MTSHVWCLKQTFSGKYDPPKEEDYERDFSVIGREITVKLISTIGTQQFTAMRDLYLKNGHGFILLYSMASLKDFNGLVDRREQILRVRDSDEVPLVLVGACREKDKKLREVTTKQGQEMAERLHGQFFEIDVCDWDQVDMVVKALLPKAIAWKEENEREEKRKEKEHGCVVM